MATSDSRLRSAGYPSPQLPGPRFRLGVPEGWVAGPAPGLLALVQPAERIEPFQPNVTIAAAVVPRDLEPGALLNESVAGTLEGHAEARALARGPAVIPGPDGMSVIGASQRVAIPLPVGLVRQVLSVFVSPEPLPGDFAFAYTLVCSWLDDEHDTLLRQIHDSCQIDV